MDYYDMSTEEYYNHTYNLRKDSLYRKNRRKNDPNYRMREILRSRLRKCVNYYKYTQKIPYMRNTYGIDWLGIMEHLWPFKYSELYHVDHIIPLANFNLVSADGTPNLIEIQKAFAVENHQWLTHKDNLVKGKKS